MHPVYDSLGRLAAFDVCRESSFGVPTMTVNATLVKAVYPVYGQASQAVIELVGSEKPIYTLQSYEMLRAMFRGKRAWERWVEKHRDPVPDVFALDGS